MLYLKQSQHQHTDFYNVMDDTYSTYYLWFWKCGLPLMRLPHYTILAIDVNLVLHFHMIDHFRIYTQYSTSSQLWSGPSLLAIKMISMLVSMSLLLEQANCCQVSSPQSSIFFIIPYNFRIWWYVQHPLLVWQWSNIEFVFCSWFCETLVVECYRIKFRFSSSSLYTCG